MITVFAAHAASDSRFAEELGAFLESGLDAVCETAEGLIGPSEDILYRAEEGLSADLLVLLLSPASTLSSWPRDRWEPLLTHRAREERVSVATLLLGECKFPDLLRRRAFFDATASPLLAMRRLKRWIWNTQRTPESAANPTISPELDTLYCAIADRPGRASADGATAERFVEEAQGDFEATFWIPAHGRSLAQTAGQLGAELGMSLRGRVDENCGTIHKVLAARRCLVVLDGPGTEVENALEMGGRTSTLVVTEPVRVVREAMDLTSGRRLMQAGRHAEAYELFSELLHAGIAVEPCARELVWICEQWDCLDEANQYRWRLSPGSAAQMKLPLDG